MRAITTATLSAATLAMAAVGCATSDYTTQCIEVTSTTPGAHVLADGESGRHRVSGAPLVRTEGPPFPNPLVALVLLNPVVINDFIPFR